MKNRTIQIWLLVQIPKEDGWWGYWWRNFLPENTTNWSRDNEDETGTAWSHVVMVSFKACYLWTLYCAPFGVTSYFNLAQYFFMHRTSLHILVTICSGYDHLQILYGDQSPHHWFSCFYVMNPGRKCFAHTHIPTRMNCKFINDVYFLTRAPLASLTSRRQH